MPQDTLTIVTEVTPSASLDAALATLQGRPEDKGPFSRVKGLHFARLAVIKEDKERNLAPQLVFAMVFDGAPVDCVKQVVAEARTELDAIYAHCPSYQSADDSQRINYLLQAHCKASLFYQGTENLDVETIQSIPKVRDALRTNLDDRMHHGGTAESTFSLVTDAYRKYSHLPAITGHINVPRKGRISKPAIRWRTRLWWTLLGVEGLLVLALPVFAACVIGGIRSGHWFAPWYLAFGLLPLVPVLELRRRERAERLHGKAVTPSDEHLQSVSEEEDISVQNALTHCVIVEGRFRRAVLRIVFWVLGQRVYLVDRLAGSLGGITSIHFGRWILIDPGKPARRLVFLSDYDGSWESYLGEFVDRAAMGLSAVWSNTEHFPPTEWLVRKGARDELKFKAWTRANQINTPVYYSAYRHQSLRNIENNLRIVRGVTSEPAPPREPVWLESL